MEFSYHVSIGIDLDGDACLHIQRLNEEGEHLSYLTEDEMQAVADRLTGEMDAGEWAAQLARPSDLPNEPEPE